AARRASGGAAEMRRGRRAALHLGALAMAAFALRGAAAAAPRPLRVTIRDLGFDPPDLTAAIGDTIEWKNEDFVDHTATETSGVWDIVLPAGSTARLVVEHPGVLAYYCR